jgi:hypothetical protein
MKTKLKAFLLIIVISTLFNQLFAQAFEKGNWNIDVELGGAAYGVLTTSTLKVGGLPAISDSDVSATSNRTFRLGGEYGISNRIGLGLKIGASSYNIAPDDRDTIKSISSTDFGLYFNFHLLRNANRNDLFLTLGLGLANAEWIYQENPMIFLSTIKGGGNYVVLGITDRIFFSDHIGMLLSLHYTGYNYIGTTPELSNSGKALVSGVGITNYSWKVDFQLRGIYFGTGLAIKF